MNSTVQCGQNWNENCNYRRRIGSPRNLRSAARTFLVCMGNWPSKRREMSWVWISARWLAGVCWFDGHTRWRRAWYSVLSTICHDHITDLQHLDPHPDPLSSPAAKSDIVRRHRRDPTVTVDAMVKLTEVSSEVSSGADRSAPPGALSLITVHAGRAKIVLALLKVSPISFLYPFDAHCCRIGTAIKHPMPCRPG